MSYKYRKDEIKLTSSMTIPRKADLNNSKCPSRIVVDSITGVWGILIIRNLATKGTLRNSELKKSVDGISEKMLSDTLKRLERIGLIERMSYPELPPRVEYKLTKLGMDMSESVLDMCKLIEKNFQKVAKAMVEFDENKPQLRPWQKPKR